jgi:hypothetical protein
MLRSYRDKKVVSVFVRFRAPLQTALKEMTEKISTRSIVKVYIIQFTGNYFGKIDKLSDLLSALLKA